MNESLKLGLNNSSIIEKITDAWLELGCKKQTREALEWTIKIKAATCTAADKARILK